MTWKWLTKLVQIIRFFFQALVIVMPMLGFGYLITMVGPDQATAPWGYTAFQIVRSVVLSTQVTHMQYRMLFNHLCSGPSDQPALLLRE